MPIIDIHFHGTKNIDVEEINSPEQVLKISEEYQEIEGFLLAIYPDEIKRIRQKLSYIKKAMQMQTSGVKILGAYLEGPFLNPKKSGALKSEHFFLPDIDKLKQLIDGYEDIIKIITIAPELPNAIRLIETCVSKGIIVSMGHSDATFKEAYEGFRAGARLITHLFNAMREIHHREPGIAGFGLINQEIYIEVIGDGRHLSDEILKWIFEIKNPDRIILVSDMVKDSGDEQKIKGGDINLYRIKERLLSFNFDREKIYNAVYKNPKTLLGLNSL